MLQSVGSLLASLRLRQELSRLAEFSVAKLDPTFGAASSRQRVVALVLVATVFTDPNEHSLPPKCCAQPRLLPYMGTKGRNFKWVQLCSVEGSWCFGSAGWCNRT